MDKLLLGGSNTMVNLSSSDFSYGGSKDLSGGGSVNIFKTRIGNNMDLFESDVVIQNPRFTNSASAGSVAVFHSPSCPHCVSNMPVYQQLANLLVPHGIMVGKLDCNKHPKACKMMNIKGVPAIFTVSPGGAIMNEYKGHHNVDDMFDYVCKSFGICQTMSGGGTGSGCMCDTIVKKEENNNNMQTKIATTAGGKRRPRKSRASKRSKSSRKGKASKKKSKRRRASKKKSKRRRGAKARKSTKRGKRV